MVEKKKIKISPKLRKKNHPLNISKRYYHKKVIN